MSQTTDEVTVDSPPESRARARNGQFPPARGTSWSAIEAAAASVLTHADAKLAREALVGALTATKWVRAGKDLWIEVPDHQIRGPMGAKALEWLIGKPIERVQVEDVTPGAASSTVLTAADLRAMAAEDPTILIEIVDSIVRSAKPAQAATDKTVTAEPAQKRLIGNQEVSRG